MANDTFEDKMRRRKDRLNKMIESNVADTDGDPDSVKTKARNAVAAGLQAANEVFVPESKTDVALVVAGPALGAAGKLRKLGKVAGAADEAVDFKKLGRTRADKLSEAEKAVTEGADARKARRLGLEEAELPKNIDARERAARRELAGRIREGENKGKAAQIGKPRMLEEATSVSNKPGSNVKKGTDYEKEVFLKKRRKSDETDVGNEESTKPR